MYGRDSQLGGVLDMAADLDFVKRKWYMFAITSEDWSGRENAKHAEDHPEVVADLTKKFVLATALE